VLAHAQVQAERPGHKYRLLELARDLREARQAAGLPRDTGLHRRAVELGRVAPWIAENLPAIELVEKKMYNRHDWSENLKLAFSPATSITPR
jgi:hypothetical protein